MATRNGRASIKGRGADLRAEPGDGALDRLLGASKGDLSTNAQVETETSQQISMSTHRQGGMRIKRRVSEALKPRSIKESKGRSAKKTKQLVADRDERVKVSFYLSPEQRDELERSLVEARQWSAKMDGRRLDQSALVRVILSGVIGDFRKNQERSLLVKWLTS